MESIVLIVFVVIVSIMIIYLMISDILQKRRDTKLKDFFKWLEEAPEMFGVKDYGMDDADWLPELDRWRANVNIVGQLRLYDNDDWVSSNFRARSYGWLPKKTLEQSITEQVKDYLSKKNE